MATKKSSPTEPKKPETIVSDITHHTTRRIKTKDIVVIILCIVSVLTLIIVSFVLLQKDGDSSVNSSDESVPSIEQSIDINDIQDNGSVDAGESEQPERVTDEDKNNL